MSIHRVVALAISVTLLGLPTLGCGADPGDVDVDVDVDATESPLEDSRPDVVYFVPHQDDETLSMGASIAAHTDAGRTVYVVLMTDGEKTSAHAKINARLQKEGRAPLTQAELVAARNREFIAALAKLGVPKERVFFEHHKTAQNDDPLGVNDATAAKVIDKYIAKFGSQAAYKTMSWLDISPDHYKLGYTLNNRCIKKKLDCRFYQGALNQPGAPTLGGPEDGSWKIQGPRGGTYKNIKARAAAAEYKVWNPLQGRYAVGDISVPILIGHTYDTYYSLWHRDNASWASEGCGSS